MFTIGEWLASLGMVEYTERFVENRIDLSVLKDLTDQNLKDLGVVLGDRRKMLRAIAGRGGVASAASAPAGEAESGPQGGGGIARGPQCATRRHLGAASANAV